MPGLGPALMDLQARTGRKVGGDASMPDMGPLDYLAMTTMGIPGVGDITGAAADINMYINKPEERTPANFGLSALGMLPFIPGAGVIRKAIGRSDVPPPSIDDLETATMDLATGNVASQKGGMHFQTNQELQDVYPDFKRAESGFYSPETNQFYSRELSDIVAGFPPKVGTENLIQGLGSQTLEKQRYLNQAALIESPNISDIPVGPTGDEIRAKLLEEGNQSVESIAAQYGLPELGPRPGSDAFLQLYPKPRRIK